MKLKTAFLLLAALSSLASAEDRLPSPFDRQVSERLAQLGDSSPAVRAGAAEALGFLRAYVAEASLIARLADSEPDVRRQAALALAWCGGRNAIPPLLDALDDPDWLTRQAAYVALTNLTGLELPFRATDPPAERREQTARWRAWWATVPADRPPEQVLALVGDYRGGRGRLITSSTYRGPPEVLLNGRIGPDYWQTKQVPFPQWITLDLGAPTQVGRVVVHQYGPAFVMTDYEVSVSLDNAHFETVERRQNETPVELVVDFPEQTARYVRITSYGTRNPTYPTTFFELQVYGPNRAELVSPNASSRNEVGTLEWELERGLRALGVLGGAGASATIIDVLGDAPSELPRYRPMVRAGIRSLGRLREPAGFDYLARLLDENVMYARNAADALGEFGDPRAVPLLIAAYPKYCKDLQARDPELLPRDDRMGFPSQDRMLETPYWIIYALNRLPLDDPAHVEALRAITPYLMANVPNDHDAMVLYEPDAGQVLTQYLMELSGLRQEACEHVFEQLGQPRRDGGRSLSSEASRPDWPTFPAYHLSAWLPVVCTDPDDTPRLIALLNHNEGFVRLNACKALAWMGDPRAIEPVAAILGEAPNEAHFGYSGTFKDEEYNDPASRWREGLLRVLGQLGAQEHTPLIAGILNDEGSVLEVRRAAADALAELAGPEALEILQEAALHHDFYTIRHVARDALRTHGLLERPELQPVRRHRRGRGEREDDPPDDASPTAQGAGHGKAVAELDLPPEETTFDTIVFIKGSNDIPNTKGTVEQADRWRMTYVVTDSGPVYRPGDNLYLLSPPRPGGRVTPLTQFTEGYVGEPEVSWDGRQVVFTRRGRDDPWWQIYRINIDGTGLTQLTDGPYHHVGPAFLPDGRIVLASSRVGVRDEYHGYPCTALFVMNPDGSDLRPIALNIGRDNEPAVMADGRIAFSRLEVFYSRNKTELTLHAMRQDGTQDVVLYGPERRQFWRTLDVGPRTPAHGQESPLTHRVLRMTQPQSMPDERSIIVATQGGLTLIGPRRDTEQIISPDNKTRAYTTPWPLPDGRILCASTLKTPNREEVDLGLYILDPATGELELVYNDPATADFEARPIMARRLPPLHAGKAVDGGYSGRFFCSSVFTTQLPEVIQKGRLVRLIEGVPVVGRHSTHTNPWEVWKNHGGTFARVLGTAPLAPDGSFHLEVPADRLLHLQVLDSDRRVIGNQLTWIYPRPGETKSCVGCHENPHTTPGLGKGVRSLFPEQPKGCYAEKAPDPFSAPGALASHYPPLEFLPRDGQFNYRAKAWFKGHLPDEIEERTRTVHAVNLLGR
ncbi:MAG: HEAT repeat domain-containing protein [Thermoguttaceae bacterium]|nr:HEAT repeat domain-containing protein [Thermoguttaceae bacterium]